LARRGKRLAYSVLRIPGTHGTWPRRLDWRFERENGGQGYVILTWRTWQRTWFFWLLGERIDSK